MGFFEGLVWLMMGAEVWPYVLALVTGVVYLGLFYRVLKARSKK